jgi:hypothetical protein
MREVPTVQVQNQSFFQEGYIEVEKFLMLSSARNSIREQFRKTHQQKKEYKLEITVKTKSYCLCGCCWKLDK